MSDEVAIDVADAVVDLLRAASDANMFGVKFTVVRTYEPIYDLKNDSDIRVSVMPQSDEEKALTRGLQEHRVGIGVMLQKKVETSSNAEIDPLVKLYYKLRKAVRCQLQAVGASWNGTTSNALYIGEHLINHKLFSAPFTAVFFTTVRM